MSGGNGISPSGGTGGKVRTARMPSGLTQRQERALARRALRARLAESKAGAAAGKVLNRCVEILAESVEGDGVSPTEARRTADTMMALTKRAQEADPGAVGPEEGETPQVHIHLTPDTLDAALGHIGAARRGERANGHDGNGSS